MDLKTTFFHEDLDEEIYIQQPEGFVEKGKVNLVCPLKKSFVWIETSSMPIVQEV